MSTYIGSRSIESEDVKLPNSVSAYSNSYRKIATSNSSYVDIMLDVGEFCTGCAHTSRRLTIDGKLQKCSKHGNKSEVAQRSLDQLSEQLKKFNTRLLPDKEITPNKVDVQTGTSQYDQRLKQNQLRRSQQELYRQKSLSQKQAQYQQKLREHRNQLQNESQRMANETIGRQASDFNTLPHNHFTNERVSNNRTKSLGSNAAEFLDEDYEFVNTRVNFTGLHMTARDEVSPRSTVTTPPVNHRRGSHDETEVSVQTTKCFSSVLSELNSRFNHPQHTSHHSSGSNAISDRSSSVNGDNSIYRSISNGSLGVINQSNSVNLDTEYDVPDSRFISNSIADVRRISYAHSIQDNRHKRFSGDFTLTPHERAPSHPSLTTHQAIRPVRNAVSTNVLAHNDSSSFVKRQPVKIDENAALDAMLAELTTPVDMQQRPLSRTNSTRVRKYCGPSRSLTSGRIADIGRGSTQNKNIKMSGPVNINCVNHVLQSRVYSDASRVSGSQTMGDLSSKPEVPVEHIMSRDQQLASLSRSISSGCDNSTLSDILMNTFNLQSTREKVARDDDLDDVLEKAETEVFTGDITLNRVFSLKKDGRYTLSSHTNHKCTPPKSNPPIYSNQTRIKELIDDNDSTKDNNSSKLSKQSNTEIITPISEQNLLRLVENNSSSTQNKLQYRNSNDEYVNMITSDQGQQRKSVVDYISIQHQIPALDCAAPKSLPSKIEEKHDYINFINGEYKTDDGEVLHVPTSCSPDNDQVICNDDKSDIPSLGARKKAIRLNKDYVNKQIVDTDLTEYERSHRDMLSEDWNIDREIPRRKKYTSTSSIHERLDNSTTSVGLKSNINNDDFDNSNKNSADITIISEISTNLSEISNNSEERSYISSECSIISSERSISSAERSSLYADRSSISSERESSVSIENAFENALENISSGENSENDELILEDGCVLQDLIGESNKMTENIISSFQIKEEEKTKPTIEEDCFFPYLTGRNIKQTHSEAGDSGNDSAHMDHKSLDSSGDNKTYDSGSDLAGVTHTSIDEDLDLDEMVMSNHSTIEPATLQQITSNAKATPRKKRKYGGAKERVHVSNFQQFHGSSEDKLDVKEVGEDDSMNESYHDTSMTTSVISSMDGVTFIDSDDSECVDSYNKSTSSDITDSKVAYDDRVVSQPKSWNTLMSEDSSSIISPEVHHKQNSPSNSTAQYVYKASSSKGNSDRFDIACRKSGIVHSIMQCDNEDDNKKVISENLDIKKVILNFSMPTDVELRLSTEMLEAHRVRQNTRKRTHIRKSYRILADGSRELIEPPVITRTGYTSGDILPYALPEIASDESLQNDQDNNISSIPIDVKLRYHHIQLNKNKCTSSSSLQKTLQENSKQLTNMTNRTGVKETTL